MSKVAYDLDTSGGLMPLIRALIKPPDEDPNPPKQKRTQHPYYRRPGKGHNRDCCDACQEGGDLICCDRCPASFHLGCHDPPLEEADIPLGQWLCLECRSSGERRAGSPTTSHRSFEGDKKSRSLRVNRSNSCVSSASSSSRSKHEREREADRELPPEGREPEPEDLTPMETLVRAAKIMNPTQFQLPREMRVYCPFPGTDKVERNGKVQLPHVKDSWGCVPLPARLCFHCRQSCRAAPLLQCDYCPLLYHQDCLDPPLTALPSGRWMCPNHVEQYIDWQLVNSISATERVALWQRLSGPVDQNAIRVEFLRRARTSHPPFRVRLQGAPPRGRVAVPHMVRHHYRRPPPLMPSRREHQRCNRVLNTNRNFNTSDDEKEDSRKKVICMNLHCPRYLSKNSLCEHDSESDSDSVEEQEKCAMKDLQEISEKSESICNKRKSEDNILDSPDSKESVKKSLTISPKRRKLADEESDEPSNGQLNKGKLEIKNDSNNDVILGIVSDNAKEIKEILFSVEEQLKKLDGRLVKLLAFQRLQQLMDAANADLDDSIAEIITRSIDKSSLSRYGFKHIALPSELLSRVEMERIAREVCGAVAPREEVQRLRTAPPALSHPVPALLMPAPLPPAPSLTAMPVRATLCPIERPARNGLGDGLGRPVPMRLSRLSVGSGGGCDLQLDRYGSCGFVSERHALIFYDEVTHHFELINYSEHGSLVNGQLYSCDFTRGASGLLTHGAVAGAEEKAAALRAIAAKRKGPIVELNGPTVGAARVEGACRCVGRARDSGALVAGWEGGALLPHGALLQFGCFMFVFSITDAHMLSME